MQGHKENVSILDKSSVRPGTAAVSRKTGITGYSLVGSNPNNVNANDFAGDDFTFSIPTVTPPPAPVVSGTFNFDSDALGKQTTFTDTSGSINATFSGPADTASSGGFVVQNFAAGFPSAGFSGYQLVSTQPNSVPLSVAFDHTLGGGSVNFAGLTGSGTFTATETLNGVAVGTAVGSGNAGLLNFGGVSFNGLTFTDTATAFGIDNLDVSSAPEPSQMAGMAFTALGLDGLLLRARKKKAQAS